MRRVLIVLSVAGLLLGGLAVAPAGSAGTEPTGGLYAGAARADITPPVTTPMWGYSARAFYAQPERWGEQRTNQVDTDLYAKAAFLRSEGVHTRLYARAMVLRNGEGRTMALVQTDLGGITGELHRAVANAVEDLGIERDFILLSGTHTHGGPGTIHQPVAHAALVGDAYDPRTFKRVVDGVVKAVRLAHERLAPARAALGQSLLLDASANRAFPAFQRNPCPDEEAVEELFNCTDHAAANTDPYAIDPSVTVLRVDRTDGVPLGAWTSFAAHGTMFGAEDMRFSGDNQGYSERLIEEGIADRARAAGIPLPDDHQVIAGFANGTEGDMTPRGAGHNRFAAAEDSGRRQARAVLEGYDALAGSFTDDLELDARWTWLYMTGEEDTSPIAVLGADGGCPAGLPGVMPGQGDKCPFLVLSGTGPQWFPLQMLRVGDLAVASYPGEMTVQMGRRIRKRILDSPANDGQVTRAIVVGLANDYMGYTTTPEEYEEQRYEGTFTLWGPEQGNLLRNRYGDLADRLFAGRPNPDSLEPPDTSGLQADNVTASQPASLVPVEPRDLVHPPLSVERGSVTSFSWVGGSPSVELEPDEVFIELQRIGPDGWTTVATDAGIETLLDHWKQDREDQWAIQWDIPLDAPGGFHRFAVRGRWWNAAAVDDYELTSAIFAVQPNAGLSVTAATRVSGTVHVQAAHPAPAGTSNEMARCSAAKQPGVPCPNFRWRAPAPTSGTVTALLDGTEVTGAYDPAAGAYVLGVDAPVGTALTVEPGGLVDGYGNTNTESFTVVL